VNGFLSKALGTLAVQWVILAGSPPASGDERIAPIPVEDFARLLADIKPQPGESRWREIPWLTDISEARRRAVAEDKPLVIFTAADGSPLGRT
jgi:hypothetical protein